MTNHTYDQAFIRYTAASSRYSAATVTALLAPLLRINSVLDVGCAAGTWLASWRNHITDVHGVDGEYVDRDALQISKTDFTPIDLNHRFDLGRRYDLVQSLEVAEHIEPMASATFIDNIARHAAKFVLFSAAPPGQGGEYHINEQSYNYWRKLFAEQGFVACDGVRPLIQDDPEISYWYRYNTLLYVRRESLRDLPAQFQPAIGPPDTPLRDVSPMMFQARKAMVRCLPLAFQHKIARLKAHYLPTGKF